MPDFFIGPGDGPLAGHVLSDAPGALQGRAYIDWGMAPTTTGSGSMPSPAAESTSTGVNPTETQYALYGHTMPLLVIGKARIGSEIIAGPWIESGLASGINSCGVEADPTRIRTLVELAFDSQVVWTGSRVGDGVLDPAGFTTEPFTCRFYSGSLTQSADPLETSHFGADAVAYRPQTLIAIENLPLANTKFRKYPYVSGVILDQDGEEINFGEAFERLAASPWVDFADFETSGLTDGVPNGGLIIAQDAEFLSIMQDFGRFYPNWDILQTDKLRIVDRGASITPDIFLDTTRLMGDVTITRQGQDTVKSDLELSTIDPDADYTIVPSVSRRPRDPVAVTTSVGKDTAYLPVVMDAETRQAIVTFANYYREVTRKTISGTAMAYGLEIEPGALVSIRNLSDDFYNETFKVAETTHGANNTVEFTAASILRCSFDISDAEASFVSASDTRYDVSSTMDQVIPACAVGDMMIAAVMHRSALTPPAGWDLVESATAVYTASGGGNHSLSLFSRVCEMGDSGSTTTWTQASSLRISVHIQAFHSTVRTLVVVGSASSHVDDTDDTSIATAVVSATGDGQVGVAFATSVFISGLVLTDLVLTMDAGAHQTTLQTGIANNRLCGGYALVDLSENTTGLVQADYTPDIGGGWAAVSLVLG